MANQKQKIGPKKGPEHIAILVVNVLTDTRRKKWRIKEKKLIKRNLKRISQKRQKHIQKILAWADP